MAKGKLSVTTEVGIFSRRTDRPYKFVIVARGLRANVVERRHKQTVANAKDAITYYEKKLATEPEKEFYSRIKHEGVLLTGRQTAEFYLTQSREIVANDARDLAAKFAAAAAEGFSAPSWSSRLDLAKKAALDLAEYNEDVRVYDVETGARVW